MNPVRPSSSPSSSDSTQSNSPSPPSSKNKKSNTVNVPPPRRSRRRLPQIRGRLPQRERVVSIIDNFAQSAASKGPSFLATSVSSASLGSAGAILGSVSSPSIWNISLFASTLFAGYNFMFPEAVGIRGRIWQILKFIKLVPKDAAPPNFLGSLRQDNSNRDTEVPTVSGQMDLNASWTSSDYKNNLSNKKESARNQPSPCSKESALNQPSPCSGAPSLGSASCSANFMIKKTRFDYTTEFLYANHTMVLALCSALYALIITVLFLSSILQAGISAVGVNDSNVVPPSLLTPTTSVTPTGSNREDPPPATDIVSLALDLVSPEIVLLVASAIKMVTFLFYLMRRFAKFQSCTMRNNALVEYGNGMSVIDSQSNRKPLRPLNSEGAIFSWMERTRNSESDEGIPRRSSLKQSNEESCSDSQIDVSRQRKTSVVTFEESSQQSASENQRIVIVQIEDLPQISEPEDPKLVVDQPEGSPSTTEATSPTTEVTSLTESEVVEEADGTKTIIRCTQV